MATKVGTILDDKYEILKEIGRGGMSIVYLALDHRLNKQWAIKEMKNDGSKSTATLLKGLEREANILKNVDHPVLPRIVDIINNKGTIYVVMDFIEGTNLADILKREGAQNQEDVIEWSKELASALDYLHSMNPPIIYRDMKPANVMLKPEGGVKLIDFGTAKEYTIESNADTTALGTRGYAAPEQFGDSKGRGIYKTDARTDIYNLGATMYHMVTGMNPCEPPYEIKPIRRWNNSLSAGLEQIILKCTQPNPNDRYQSCSELLYALDHYTELDDSYRAENKKKFAIFVTTAGLAIAGAVVSLVGYKGIQRVTQENYTAYIDKGNSYKIQKDYKEAAGQYKLAFDLKGDEAAAYVNYIDLYIDASKDAEISEDQGLNLADGLATIANRVNNKNAFVAKNPEVLYRLGLAYFAELSDYNAAYKYFSMIDKTDQEYGELASYYGSISFILSSNSVNVSDLIDQVNGFADYNMNKFINTDEQKFINYEMLGRIYATYIQTDGVAEKAETVMSQALDDLGNYNGDNVSEFDYEFNNSLSEIYYTLGKNDRSMYKLAINACNEVASQAIGNISMADDLTDNDTVTAYRTAYTNKMCRISEIYGLLGDEEKAIQNYEQAEKVLTGQGKSAASYLAKVYTEHLNFLYNAYVESYGNDITKWPKTEVNRIISIYDKGRAVNGIEKISNWLKRVSDMETLKSVNSKKEGEAN